MEGKLSCLIFAVFGFCFRLLQSAVHWGLKWIKGSQKGIVPAIKDHILLEPATVLSSKIRTGKVSSETVVQAYIDRIKVVNPLLNAVIEDRFSEALEEARAADNYVKNSGKTPEELAVEKPFLGVPFTSKGAIAVKGLDLTAGVVARKGIKAEEDCTAVANLRLAGAIPVCVTNVPELCMWGDSSNKLFGVTKNPYDLTRIPGGSSGGEGALITSGASVFGIGNDIGGSIRMPSFHCGIFGHKPSRGIVPAKGQFPTSHDTKLDAYNASGPMCRYSVDLIPMLKALAGPESAAKLKLEETVNLSNLKVYYTEDYIDDPLTSRVDPEIGDAVKKVVRHLESTFGMTAKKVSIPQLNYAWSIWLTKIFTGMPAPLGDFATKKPGQFKLGLEVPKWFLGLCDHTFYFLHMAALGAWHLAFFKSDQREENVKKFDALAEAFQELLKDNGIFIFPGHPTTAPYHEEQSLKINNYGYTGVFNLLGYPATQCPTGIASDGLPIGVQVVSNLLNDRYTLAVAREIEKQFGGWKSPSPIL